MPGKYWMALMEVAVDNGGYVTPALVARLGVPAVELRKMVSRGTLESAAHGVYRVPCLPTDRHDAFILARLWAATRVIIEDWRIDYNWKRPHTAHGDLTPSEFAAKWTTNPPQAA